MSDFDYIMKQAERGIRRSYMLGLDIITKHNKYHYQSHTKIWAVGIGGLIDNHDIRDYNPAEYTDVELFVMALQGRFIDIGGPGIQVIEYIKLVRKYYPENIDDILRLTIVSRMKDNPITPVVITDTYHPSILKLHTRVGVDISGIGSIYTNDQLSEIRTMLNQATYTIICNMQTYVT